MWLLSRFFIGVFQGMLAVGFVCGLVFLSWQLLTHLVAPDINKFLSQDAPESVLIKDSHGNVLYEYFDQYKRQTVPLEKISPHLIDATVASEDKTFFEHNGVWLPGILRAVALDAYLGEAAHGGSTITQQLIKNVILIKDKSLRRKLAEIVWAIKLEQKLSKMAILERYLNLVPYGRNSAGIQAAAQNFFNKNAIDLNPAEAAYLAALPKSPSTLSPDGPGRADLNRRQTYILELMYEQKYLDYDSYTFELTRPVKFSQYRDTISYPHFVFFVLDEAEKILGPDRLKRGGMTLETTLNPDLQSQYEVIAEKYVNDNKKRLHAYNVSLVAIEPTTGQIKAYLGSRNYFGQAEPKECKSGKDCFFDPKQDAARSLRQTGSSFKPYVYVTAFGEAHKMTPATLVADISRTFSTASGMDYSPQNYSGATYGWIPARKALAGSLNVSAVNVLAEIGVESVISTVRKLGVTAPFENCGLSLALGACEMSLLEHTAAFAGLLNVGKFHPHTGIAKITDNQKNVIYEYNPANFTQAVEGPAAFEVLDILSDNSARTYIFGNNSPLAFTGEQRVAVKTGTTQNWKDGWTVGGTNQLAVGIWMGNSSGAVMKSGSDSIITAAPLWRQIMDISLPLTKYAPWPEPYGISHVVIDGRSGKIIKPKPGQKLEPIADYAIKVETPQVPKPKVAGVSKPTAPNVEGEDVSETTIILSPWENQVIMTTPFDVKVYVGTSTEETEVVLLLDGQEVGRKTQAPFLFTLPHKLANGEHTLTAKATHYGMLENSHTIKFRTMYNPPPIIPRGR